MRLLRAGPDCAIWRRWAATCCSAGRCPSHGQGIDRLDGRLKVTGQATYAAKHEISRLAYSMLVLSTVPKGRITATDMARVKKMSGVLLVLIHQNAPRLPKPEGKATGKPGAKEREAVPEAAAAKSRAVAAAGRPRAVQRATRRRRHG